MQEQNNWEEALATLDGDLGTLFGKVERVLAKAKLLVGPNLHTLLRLET